jgi:diguanylate cyclase (GGDEF)-like protein
VPVRLLLVVMVLVPWLGLAYRTGDRIEDVYGELGFIERLEPATTRVKLLARIERELHAEGGAAAIKVAVTNLGYPLDLVEAMSGIPVRADLARARREVDQTLAALLPLGPAGIQKIDLKAVRDRFDSPKLPDPYDRGYDDLLAQNREALDAALHDLWVMTAQLDSDKTLVENLRALELSVSATRSSIEESSLLLHRANGSVSDEFGVSLIQISHRGTIRSLQSIAELKRTPVANAAKRAMANPDEAIIKTESLRGAVLTKPSPSESIAATKSLYPVMARRNIRLGELSAMAATAMSDRAQILIEIKRSNISQTILWLLASLAGTLAIAVAVARSISRPLRRLGQQAVALVDGQDHIQSITPRGPRELVASAHALNELANTLVAVQEQADALASGQLDTATKRNVPPGRLGSSVQQAVLRLSESIQLNNQLRDDFKHAANHDALTGLPNRAALYRVLEQRLNANESLVLLFVDLDHFKRINDNEGHHVGDEVLRVMSARFVECAGAHRVVARLGGDEFLIVCDGGTGVEEISELADRIRASASEPIQVGLTTLRIGASVGAATSQPPDTASTLLIRADAALYRAKSAGRNQTALTLEPTEFAVAPASQIGPPVSPSR